jgi:hypothetical protein
MEGPTIQGILSRNFVVQFGCEVECHSRFHISANTHYNLQLTIITVYLMYQKVWSFTLFSRSILLLHNYIHATSMRDTNWYNPLDLAPGTSTYKTILITLVILMDRSM